MAIAERVTMQKGEHVVTVFQVDARELRTQGYMPVGATADPPGINPDMAVRDTLSRLAGTQPSRRKK